MTFYINFHSRGGLDVNGTGSQRHIMTSWTSSLCLIRKEREREGEREREREREKERGIKKKEREREGGEGGG